MDEERLTEQDFNSLVQLANQLKLRELFEEPSCYEDEDRDETT